MPFDPSACTPEVVDAISTRRFWWLQSVYLACIAYGIVVTLFSMCIYHILQNVYAQLRRISAPEVRHKDSPLNSDGFCIPWCRVGHWAKALSWKMVLLLVYVLAMMALSTMAIASMMRETNNALVLRGCWDGVTTGETLITLGAMGNYAYVLANWGADGILVWRCWVLYKGFSRFPVWAALALPLGLYVSIIGMGLSFMVPNRPRSKTRDFEVIYSCLTLVLNVVVTCMISFRLLSFRYKVKTALGAAPSTQYVSIVAMLIESAALVVIFNAFFVATMRSQSLVRYIAFAGNVQIQVIAPLLIIFRVLQGKAWAAEQGDQGTVDNFKFASYAGSSIFERGRALESGQETQDTPSAPKMDTRENEIDVKSEELLHRDRRVVSIETSRLSPSV